MLDAPVSYSSAVSKIQELDDPEFREDMPEYFSGRRRGSIVRHGFRGKGGEFYSRWLKEHTIYEELVTKPELQLINTFVGALTEICGETVHLYEGGVGSLTAFKLKTLPLLMRIAARRGQPIRYTVVDVAPGPFETVKQYISDNNLPFIPHYIQANMFNGLPKLNPNSIFWVPGITFTNISADAIQNSTEQIYTNTFKHFHEVLPKGSILAFTSANNQGMDPEGKSMESLYNHMWNNKYQLWIYERVARELPVAGDYDCQNFGEALKFQWHQNDFVLTRHTNPSRRMQFDIGRSSFDLRPDFDGYHGNNFRPPNDLIEGAATKAEFADCKIFSLPGSNLCMPVLING